MNPTATLVIAAPVAALFVPGTHALASPLSPPEPELRLRFHASVTLPGAADAMSPDALLAVQWSVPPEFVALRLADGPVIALDLARHASASPLVMRTPDGEPSADGLLGASAPGLYTLELSLRPPMEDQPARLPAPAPVPAPAMWFILPLAPLAAHRRRWPATRATAPLSCPVSRIPFAVSRPTATSPSPADPPPAARSSR